jgi:hypothetical protein
MALRHLYWRETMERWGQRWDSCKHHESQLFSWGRLCGDLGRGGGCGGRAEGATGRATRSNAV